MKIRFKTRDSARDFKRKVLDSKAWVIRKASKDFNGEFAWEVVRK